MGCRRGDGDDDDSIDDDFDRWCVDFFAALEAQPELLGAQAAPGADGTSVLATYRVEMLAGEGDSVVLGYCRDICMRHKCSAGSPCVLVLARRLQSIARGKAYAIPQIPADMTKLRRPPAPEKRASERLQ